MNFTFAANSMNITFCGRAIKLDFNKIMLLTFMMFCIVAPLELGQLIFAFTGALCYVSFQATKKVTSPALKKQKKGVESFAGAVKAVDEKDKPWKARDTRPYASRSAPSLPESAWRELKGLKAARKDIKPKCPAGEQDYRKKSAQPVVQPSFESDSFEAQVEELVTQISSSPEGDKLVQEVVTMVRKTLESWLPEAEISGFASGDILRGSAFAVAIPQVEILLTLPTDIMAERLENRLARPYPNAAGLDVRTLQKSMLRSCVDALAELPYFKFRRSAFKGQDPKVTLIAEVGAKPIPIDFLVNSSTVLQNASILAECAQIDLRAKKLILLVKQWAKNRGVSYAAKGHPSPYAWTLMTVYFLQVWKDEDQPILPVLTAPSLSQAQLKQRLDESQTDPELLSEPQTHGTKSLADLFKEFFKFYSKTFHWRREAVSVRAGKRLGIPRELPVQQVVLENGMKDITITIEDPFEPTRNLMSAMTGVTLTRLQEEIARADNLASRGESLSALVEPWVPAQRDPGVAEDDV